MKGDERFMSGRTDITIEIMIYLSAFFATIAASALVAALDISWHSVIRTLSAITGA